MNVRCALMDDLEEIIELYDAVSDAMKESAFDIGWRKNLYPSSNLPAIRLYEKCGFLLQGKQMMDYGKTVIAYLYEKLI